MKNVGKFSILGAAALGVIALAAGPSALAQSEPTSPPATQAQPSTAPDPMATPATTAQTDAPPATAPDAMPMTQATPPAPPAGDPTAAPAGLVRMPDGSLSNGPVPDTKANRHKFGAPMSNAGKKSAPIGN